MASAFNVNTINDLESLMIALIEESEKKFKEAAETYKLIPPGSNEMLSWKRPIEIQPLTVMDLVRVGTVGDGNCLLHSILFACSPTYRSCDARSRSALADAFRTVLCARDFELMEIADSIYDGEIGGAAALEEDLMDLHKKRDEMDVMMAPVIAHMFGYNLLAVQLREGMELIPVRSTASGFNRERPTILVNYLGGGLDFGNFRPSGEGRKDEEEEGAVFHYETIIASERPQGRSKNTTLRNKNGKNGKNGKNTKNTLKSKTTKSKAIILGDATTQFNFAGGDPSLESILELFGL